MDEKNTKTYNGKDTKDAKNTKDCGSTKNTKDCR